jgi:hypothetical protein
MFFPGGDATQSVLVNLVEEDIRKHRGHADVSVEGQFVAISSDIDWMSGTKFSTRDLFTRFVPVPGVASSHRNEMLIGASCVGWLTVSGDETISQNLEIDDVPPRLLSPSTAARTLIWRFDPAHWMALKIAGEGGRNDDDV